MRRGSGRDRAWGRHMEQDSDRAFHLERAKQCRSMAEASDDPVIRKLHEELAEFHEAEATSGNAAISMSREPA